MNFIKKITHFILATLPPDLRDDILGLKRFRSSPKVYPYNRMLIIFFDGRNFHGGLCDRFKGIVSLFHYCLCTHISFKINHTFPFELSDYLLPNEYDWTLSTSNKISFHRKEAKYMNLIADPSAKRLVHLKTKRQIHANANRDIVEKLNSEFGTNYTWGELFKKLFKPTEELNHLIRLHQSEIGGNYICAVFRFQNLLGDFAEYEYTGLTDEAKNKLIAQCRQAVLDLQKREVCKKILVTSDSSTFLQEIKKMENVYAFPEKVVHIDNTKGESHSVYMKSFLDFYLLSEGDKIFSIGTSRMYKTEFPMYAAKVRDVPFERILMQNAEGRRQNAERGRQKAERRRRKAECRMKSNV
jgi:hypothetical protein